MATQRNKQQTTTEQTGTNKTKQAKTPKIKRERIYKETTTQSPEERKAAKEAERLKKRNEKVKAQIQIQNKIIPEIIKENKALEKTIPKKQRAYTPEQKAEIFENIINNIKTGESLFKSCVKYKIPTETFYQWIDQDSKLTDIYARASAQRADSLFDKTIDIAIKMPDVNRARLVVDTIKWVAGKLNPHKYSDKQTINIVGNVNQNITTMTPEDRDKKILELMQKAGNIIDITPQ